MRSGGTRRLADFIAAISAAIDEGSALRAGVDGIADALEAELVAVVRGGRVVASWGEPSGGAPDADLELGEQGDRLVVARSARPLDPDELGLLTGMANALALTVALQRTVAAERRQTDRNALLLASLRGRQRLLEEQAAIQRRINDRDPLPAVLEQVVVSAERLLGDELPALFLLDEDRPGYLKLVAHRGLPPNIDARIHDRRVGEGVGGRAVAERRLIVREDYADGGPGTLDAFVEQGLSAAMAAPVFEDGDVVGALLVSSFRPGRRYRAGERDALASLAQHVSLALHDARAAAALDHLALHDALTGLPNRALFLDRLEHAKDRAARGGNGLIAVLFCDLDRFKSVNDSLGHLAGDELLAGVARRLSSCLRAGDTAARLGGDEFAILLEGLEAPQEAEAVADRVLAALRDPIVVADRPVVTDVSIGIAHGGDDTLAGEDLVRAADQAMYRAKSEGRARAVTFAPSMQEEALARVELLGDLHRAVDGDELEVHYQPIVALTDRRLVGFEALVRWRHPERGLIFPEAFIGVAEETGRIVDLGQTVLRAACAAFAGWRTAHPEAGLETISVNLSGRQLAERDLPDVVAAALDEAGLAPGRLLLEITETALMSDVGQARAALAQLRALGVRIAVDDFGTGWSSLRYLREFPIDVLKMAKPFVDGLRDGCGDEPLAGAIVDLGGHLGLTVVAEGIEVELQAERLDGLGCGLGQGWWFSPALDAAAVGRALGEPLPPETTWRLGRASDELLTS